MALVGVWAAIIGGLIIAGIVLWWAWPAIAGLLAASGEGVAVAGLETTEAEIAGQVVAAEAEAGTATGMGEDAFAYYMRQAETLDISTAENEAVVYSGPGNSALARQFGLDNGRATIEMTDGGAWLNAEKLYDSGLLTRDEADQVWATLSLRYAQGASGTVVGFVEGASPVGIFSTIEWPALLNNPSVINVLTGGF